LSFLSRWPTLVELQKVKANIARALFYARISRSHSLIEERVQQVKKAQNVHSFPGLNLFAKLP